MPPTAVAPAPGDPQLTMSGQLRGPDYDTVKVVLIGPMSVGKSSMVRRFLHNEFEANSLDPTIGVAYNDKDLVMSDGKSVRWRIWDTGGQERFKSLTPMYYRDARVCFLVFDLNVEKSFTQVKTWYGEIAKHLEENTVRTTFMVIANKLDLERNVPYSAGQAWAASIGAQYLEVSALSGENISQVFEIAYAQMRMNDRR